MSEPSLPLDIEFAATRGGGPQPRGLAVCLAADEQVTAASSAGLDPATLARTAEHWRFAPTPGRLLEVALDGADRALLLGLGARAAITPVTLEEAAGQAVARLRASGIETLEILAPGLGPTEAAHLALGARLAGYEFARYRTVAPPDGVVTLRCVRVLTPDPEAARRAFAPLADLAEAVCFARDLVSEPPNVLFPEAFAERLERLETLGVTREVLDEPALQALGMGALLGVGQGSPNASRIVVLRWSGGPEGQRPLALVGKGVCFDSGGLSLKAKVGMEEMKWDMAGAAAVAGAVEAVARWRTPANVVAVLGLVENMPDGRAQRPSDVVTSMSGQTIEVVNTDAEGRLVLADALWYVQQTFEPAAVIDVATLTGAIQVALGADCAGLFSNDDALAGQLLAAATCEGEGLWRMPLLSTYERHIRSPVADMKNLGEPHGEAISAALFLQRFIRERPWAHIDMAASAWSRSSTRGTCPDGATGFGVRLLARLVSDRAGSAEPGLA